MYREIRNRRPPAQARQYISDQHNYREQEHVHSSVLGVGFEIIALTTPKSNLNNDTRNYPRINWQMIVPVRCASEQPFPRSERMTLIGPNSSANEGASSFPKKPGDWSNFNNQRDPVFAQPI